MCCGSPTRASYTHTQSQCQPSNKLLEITIIFFWTGEFFLQWCYSILKCWFIKISARGDAVPMARKLETFKRPWQPVWWGQKYWVTPLHSHNRFSHTFKIQHTQPHAMVANQALCIQIIIICLAMLDFFPFQTQRSSFLCKEAFLLHGDHLLSDDEHFMKKCWQRLLLQGFP